MLEYRWLIVHGGLPENQGWISVGNYYPPVWQVLQQRTAEVEVSRTDDIVTVTPAGEWEDVPVEMRPSTGRGPGG